MEKTSNRTWTYIKSGLFYLLSFVLIMYIVFEVFMPETTVKVFQFKPYVVLTQSMEPEIMANDMVVVKNFDVEDLKNNDIITFYADINYDGEKEIVTHYIYSINENTDGDYIIRTNRYYANETEEVPDPWVLNGDDVLGLYSYHIPWVGTVILFLQSPFGIAAMIVNIGVIVAVVVMIKQGKNEKEQNDGEEKSD